MEEKTKLLKILDNIENMAQEIRLNQGQGKSPDPN